MVLFKYLILDTVLSLVAISLLFLLIRYYWRRRHLYIASAKVKGPTSWPLVGNALEFVGNKDILDVFTEVSSTYGSPSRIWLGQKFVLFLSRPEQLEIVLNSPHALNKDSVYDTMRPFLGDGLITAKADRWKQNRKVINPTFNTKILASYIEVFHEQTKICMENLGKYDGKGIFNVFPALMLCTLDIIWETALGNKINAQSGTSKYVAWINDLVECASLRMIKIWLRPDFLFYMTSLGKRQKECIESLNKLSMSSIKKKREEYQKNHERKSMSKDLENEGLIPKRKIFLDYLIQLSEEGAAFTDEELLDEANTIEIAGSDSTAVTDSFILLMLGMHPEIQRKVYEEQEDIFRNEDRLITYEDLRQMKYLEKVIKETLRLFPAIPFIAKYISEDIELDGFAMPKGSTCVMGIFEVHRNSEYWPDPLTFNPDRFEPERISKMNAYIYLPFSGGPRNCIGAKFAMMSMKVLVSEMVRNYEIYTDYKNVEEIKLKQYILLKAADGWRIAIKRRSPK